MKLVLLFTLLPNLIFAQIPTSSSGLKLDAHTALDTLLQGDWFLAETRLEDSYWHVNEDKAFTTQASNKQKLTFTNDSLYVNLIDAERFYQPPKQEYQVLLQYDSSFQANYVTLIQGKKKKQRQLASYEILACTYDEFVFRSYKYETTGLDQATYSIVYTYRRAGVDSLLKQLNGKWYACTPDFMSFGIEESDTSLLHFSRLKEDVLCEGINHRIDINFGRDRHENYCSVYAHTAHVGSGYKLYVSINPEHQQIRFGKEDSVPYEIVQLDSDSLILRPYQKDSVVSGK